MGTNYAPLIGDLFLFCCERDFMASLSSRYLDDVLNVYNFSFECMLGRVYPPEIQLNKANASDIEAPFLYFHLFISN